MTEINRLIRLNIEIEGLLRVLEERHSEDARSMLAEKFEDYAALMRAYVAGHEPLGDFAAPVTVEVPEPEVFTLNDKFRFRRELFAGDDDDFSSTLVLLAQMPSYEEAADYLFHDLLWDRRDENVQAFMEILKAHMPA